MRWLPLLPAGARRRGHAGRPGLGTQLDLSNISRSIPALNQGAHVACAVEGDSEEEIRANLNSLSARRRLMKWNERIVIDPAVLAGKPVIRGTRLAVDFIVGLLAQGWTEADILRNYPGVTHDDIAACLQYASETLQAEKVY